MIRPLILLVLALTGAAPVRAMGDAPRTETPIREVRLSDGTRRYSIPLTIGTAAVEAGLDTGSIGLRVLARALSPKDADRTSVPSRYVFGSGAMLTGVKGRATLGLGRPALHGEAELVAVDDIGCMTEIPDCPAADIADDEFGIMGNGLPGEGFAALFGIGMEPDQIANPLIALGVKRWIVELPVPDSGAPGRMVLNPSDEEAAGYTLFRLYQPGQVPPGWHDALPGCFAAGEAKPICGLLVFDTGLGSVRVISENPLPPWPPGTRATVSILPEGGAALRTSFTTGQIYGTNANNVLRAGVDKPQIRAGLVPFFAYSILYDPDHGMIGLRPRPDSPFGAADRDEGRIPESPPHSAAGRASR
jgi:hypothetical protein